MSKTQKKHPGNIYDAFVKLMFSRILVFADFLVNYADTKFVAKIDLAGIYSSHPVKSRKSCPK